ARDRPAGPIEHPRVAVDPQPAEGERDPAGDREGEVGRAVEGRGPVALRRVDADGALAVLDRRVESAWLDGGVARFDRPLEPGRLDADRLRQLADRGGLVARDPGGVVLVRPQQRRGSGVEELEGDRARLLEHLGAVAGVSVVAEVGALVDEALA